MTRDELITELATLLAGLQVPGSLGVLGTAQEPWRRLHDAAGFGWHDADGFEKMLRRSIVDEGSGS